MNKEKINLLIAHQFHEKQRFKFKVKPGNDCNQIKPAAKSINLVGKRALGPPL